MSIPFKPIQRNLNTFVKLSKQNNKVIILDWDDTLLPSTHLAEMGHRLDTNHSFSHELQQSLYQLEILLTEILLQMFKEIGPKNVCIITNAERGWVELSAKKFIPSVIHLLQKCTIISARSTFEIEFPNLPIEWKVKAMKAKLQECFEIVIEDSVASYNLQQPNHHSTNNCKNQNTVQNSNSNCLNSKKTYEDEFDFENDSMLEDEESLSLESRSSSKDTFDPEVNDGPNYNEDLENIRIKNIDRQLHIISFGDSYAERHAVHIVASGMKNTYVKSIKLMERPQISHLLKQLQVINMGLSNIVNHEGNLDYMTTINSPPNTSIH